jgi:hypothetical protein
VGRLGYRTSESVMGSSGEHMYSSELVGAGMRRLVTVSNKHSC